MTLAMGWYAVSARKWFVGPKMNLEGEVDGIGGEKT
jgi:hypothetical protein